MDRQIRDDRDIEVQQKMSGTKEDVEWRLKYAGVLSFIVIVAGIGLFVLFMWWMVTSRPS